MMHKAYEAIPVYQRLPLSIESITICDYDQHGNKSEGDTNKVAKVLVGTKVGHLFVFKVNCNIQYARGVEALLERNCRSFSKKPILQLYANNEFRLLISLSEGVISVHDLDNFQRITLLSKTKGATYFAADLESRVSSTGAADHDLKLCVVVRRSLQFYFWKNKDFCELHADVNFQEIPKSLAWFRDSVCVGFKRDYMLVKLNGTTKEITQTGKGLEPILCKIKDNIIAMMKDDETVFINSNGEPKDKISFTWSENPINLCSQPPYILSVMSKYIEIRTMEPRLFIQNIDLQKPKIIKANKNWIVVASANSIWLLQQLPVSKQLPVLLNNKEYELALQLARMSTEESEVEKEATIQNIQILLAFDMFRQKRFEASLQSFSNLDVDPSQVIGLFPDLLPEKQSSKIEYPSSIIKLKGKELKDGLLALSEYLTQKRNEMLKITTPTVHNLKPIVAKNSVIKSRKSLLQIIDTTLLKCYLKVNNALVGPLLRLPENYCHLEEAERVLKKMEKFRELTDLYKKRGLHRKALELLLKQYNEKGIVAELVEYLQHLGNNHLDLVLTFADEIVEHNSKDCLKIFTGDTTEVESLPRRQIFDFLDLKARPLVVPYLEHIIFSLEDETQSFHNHLAISYKNNVMELIKEAQAIVSEEDIVIINERGIDMDDGSVKVVEARSKLQTFLEISKSYEPQRLLSEFPVDILLDERAVILGRQGSHEQALAIYVYSLNDGLKAESYCERVFNESPKQNKDVFLTLLKIYLQNSNSKQRSNLNNAMKVLHKYSDKIDTLQALTLLPNYTAVGEVEEFICKTLESQSQKLRQLKMIKSLLISENFQVHEKRMMYDNINCCVTEDRICCVCGKKIGDSAFARYPNDVIVHYFCCKDRKYSPKNY